MPRQVSQAPSAPALFHRVAVVALATLSAFAGLDPARIASAEQLWLVSHANPGERAAGASESQLVSSDGRYVVLTTAATGWVPNISDLNDGNDVLLWDRISDSVTLVSHAAGSVTLAGNGPSFPRGISSDGRYVTFYSSASDLVAGGSDTNASSDAFLWDRDTGTVTLVSHAASSGSTAGNGGSSPTAMTPDGRYVAFYSSATNLIAGGSDTNADSDAYLWDRVSGATVLVSHAAGSLTTAANGISGPSAISSDGNWVAFYSTATNLVTGGSDTNGTYDVFLWYRGDGFVVLASHAASSTLVAGNSGSEPTAAMSADGRYVVFSSGSSNLISGGTDTNASLDVFVYDAGNWSVTLVSHSSASAMTAANGGSEVQSISSDGAFVAFSSGASNLIAGGSDTNGKVDAFVYGRVSGSVTLVSHSSASTTATGNNTSAPRAISADGRYVAFYSLATNLIAGGTDANSANDAFLWDRQLGAVTLISHASGAATATGNFVSDARAISADGRYVAFYSSASDLVTGVIDTNGTSDALFWDRDTGTVTLVSKGAGSPSTASDHMSYANAVSADGRYVAFRSVASNLIEGGTDTNGNWDAFLWDRATGTVSLVSRAAGSSTIAGNNSSQPKAISPDGRYVVFQSVATNLVAGGSDTNGNYDAFLWDRDTRSVTLISHVTGASGTAANGLSDPLAISSNGRYVAFESQATNLVSGVTDANGGGSDAFLWDRATGEITLISHAAGAAATTGDGVSAPVGIDRTGRYVALQSSATNLVTGGTDTNGAFDTFLWDRDSGATTLISHAAAAMSTSGNGSSYPPQHAITPDGRFVVFQSTASDLVAGGSDSNVTLDVFLWSRESGGVALLSHAAGSRTIAGNGQSYAKGLSADGRHVAFDSLASNLISGGADGNGNWDAFLADTETGATWLVSRSASAPSTAANGMSFARSVSADGRLVAFHSSAANVVTGVTDTNGKDDAFLWDRETGEVLMVSHVAAAASIAGNDVSRFGAASSDGLFFAFDSIATDLMNGGFNGRQQVFLWSPLSPDTTVPSDPTVSATSPSVSTWSAGSSVQVTWSGASDEPGGWGLAGYSVEWNHTAVSTPDTTVDVPQGTDPHSTTSAALADGNDWYFHLSTCDNAGNCTSTRHAGPFWIDTVPPSAPGSVTSSSHVVGAPSLVADIAIAWGAATDALSGVATYSYAFDHNATGSCSGGGSTVSLTAASGTLADGTWYAHVCAVDMAGIPGAVVHGGPYVIDADSSGLAVYWTVWNTQQVGVGQSDGTGVVTLVTEPGNYQPIEVAVDRTRGKLYWTDQNVGYLRRSNLDGSGVATITGGMGTPFGLALDEAAGKLYFTERSAGRISRINLDGSGYQVLVSGRSNPLGLDLDVVAGKVYWAESASGWIGRANLDGSGATVIVSGQSGAQGVFVDHAGGKVYWSIYSSGVVRRANLDGSAAEHVLSNAGYVAGLAVDRGTGKIYLAVNSPNLVRRLNFDGSGAETVFTLSGQPNDVVLYRTDLTAPTDPTTVTSTTHTASAWSGANVIGMQWSGATDPGGSGVGGYSVLFDHASATSPDVSIEVPHGTDPHATTSGALADGNDWYFHVSTCDRAGLCTSTQHAGPYWIDTTGPAVPAGLLSTSHLVNQGTSDTTIDVRWSASTDSRSGVDGYSWAFDTSSSWTCETTKDGEESVTATTSPPLVGSSWWYFHLCARDNAGNWSGVATSGPYGISPASQSNVLTAGNLVFPVKGTNALLEVNPTTGGVVRMINLPFPYSYAGGNLVWTALVRPSDHHLFVQAWNGSTPTVLELYESGVVAAALPLAEGGVCCLQQLAFDPLSAGRSRVLAGAPGSPTVRVLDPGAGTIASRVVAASGNFIALAVNRDGQILVGDWGAGKIYRFTAEGAALGLFADTAATGGRTLWSMAFDSAGVLYTASDDRILKYGTDGAYLGAITNANFNAMHQVTFNPGNGLLYAANENDVRVTVLTTAGSQVGLQSYGSSSAWVAGYVSEPLAPANPTVTSTTHTPAVWSAAAAIAMQWSGASDNPGGVGMGGYSVAFDSVSDTTLDAGVEVVHGSDPHGITSPALADGSAWYFHLRACDSLGNCTATVHTGPYAIDTTAPGAPGSVGSPSHGDGLPKSDPTIDIAWGAAADGLSGVALYRYGFTSSSTPPSCPGLSQTTVGPSGASSVLADGTWYAHVCAVDAAGNPGPVTTGGPYRVSAQGPTGLEVTSTSHALSTWSNDATIDFTFSGATDPDGVAGYAVGFDRNPSSEPACAVTQAGTAFTATATDGNDGWLHVRALDGTGACGATVHLGPFWIDTVAPGVAASLDWVARRGVAGRQEAHGSDGGVSVTATAVDAAGNVYAVGMVDGASGWDYLTVKVDPTGTVAWSATYDGTGSGADQALGVALDGGGNVYVTGFSAGASGGQNMVTVKYDSAGAQQWAASYNGPGNSSDSALAVAVDGSGNVIVTGASSGSGSGWDYATVKYDAAGVQQWVARYNGTANSGDEGYALGVDAAGNVYVTGYSTGTVGGFNYATVKYDPAGAQQWVATYDGALHSMDSSAAMAVDAGGNVYVTGYAYGAGGNRDVATVKYDTVGVQQWVAIYNGPANGTDWGWNLEVDGGGNVVVAGYSQRTVGGNDYVTVKYDSAGVQQWASTYDGTGSGEDVAFDLALSDDGAVYVTGWSAGSTGGANFATVQYDAAGTQRWTASYDGSGGTDKAHNVRVGANGKVYVAGTSRGADGTNDVVVLRYAADLPSILSAVPPAGGWTTDPTVDVAWSGAADNSGGSGLAGYSIEWDHLAASTPDAVVEVPHVADPNGATSASLADGDDWWFHLRACDLAGNCGAPVHVGPFRIDRSGPSAPGAVTSASHGDGLPKADATIDLAWGAATDSHSGLDGYSVLFDGTPVSACDPTKDVEEGTTALTSPALADGTWYAHVCAVDNLGSWSEVTHGGPYAIDTTPPSAPGAVSSSTHVVGVPTPAPDLTVSWGGATDATSGVAGYLYVFDHTATGSCTGGGSTAGLTASSGALADGTWYAHVCAVDQAGNLGSVVHGGPYVIDAAQVAGRLYWSSYWQGQLGTEAPAGAAKTLLAAGGALGVALDVAGGHVYWASLGGSIHRCALDGTGDVVLMGGLAAPHGVALDLAAGKIYWMERGSLKLRRANLDGTGQEDLLTATGPYVSNLDLDLVHGKVYWVETAMARIRRANLDGSSVEDVLTGIPDVVGLELDVPRGRIFWAEYRSVANNGLVGRANLDGTGKVTLTGGREGPNAMVFDAATGWVYFAEHAAYRIGRVRWDGTGAGVALALPAAPEGLALFRLDSAPPSDPPTVSSPSHAAGVPSSDSTIDVTWSGASDGGGSGIAGYRTLFDQAAGTVPGDPATDPNVVVVAHSADPHAVSSAALSDGSWTFHLSTCDVVGFCTSTRHAGPYVIDTTPPSAPGAVTSPSHGDGLAKNDPTIDVVWVAATDNLSGVALYRYGFTSSSTQPSCLDLSQTTADLTGVSGALADGTWYAHVCAVDAAGNPGAVTTDGPYLVDTTGPTGLTVTSPSHTVSTWSNDPTIDFGFSGATDPSGIAGYSIAFDAIATTEPDTTPDQASTSFTGTAIPDSASWYVHVRACDGAGVCGATVHLGPFWMDTTAPSGVGASILVSHLAGSATTAGNYSSDPRALSAEGRYVAFASLATDLIAGGSDTNSGYDAFLWDRDTGTVTLVSHLPGSATTAGNGSSEPIALSADGRFVAFVSAATDLIAGGADTNGAYDAFLWDRDTGTVTLVSHLPGSATTAGNGSSAPRALSADGRYVALQSFATDLIAGGADTNGAFDAFLWDRDTGTVTLVSHLLGSATTAGNGPSQPRALSANGRYVALRSFATDLIGGGSDSNSSYDAFLWDRDTGTVTLVSHLPGSATTAANGSSVPNALSADGRYVAFLSNSTDLIAGGSDTNSGNDAFLSDLETGTVTLVSHLPGSATTAGNGSSVPVALSADGRYMALYSNASDLIAGGIDTNSGNDAFLSDRETGTVMLVSHRSGSPTTAGAGLSVPAALSADGRYMALYSNAPDLIAGGSDTNSSDDAFLSDRETGAVTLVSHLSGSAATAGNGQSLPRALSADGRYVAFFSNATNLIAGGSDTNSSNDTFLWSSVEGGDPTIDATVPPENAWSNDVTVDVTWSGAADYPGGSGLDGYSVLFDGNSTTQPDATVEVPHTVDPHATTSAPLADGTWYFHLSACDVAGNCSAGVHAGPFLLDTTPPSAPGTVTSASHGDGLPKSDPTIDLAWGPATDNLSGVTLYRYGFTASSTQPSCLDLSQTTAELSGISGALADGPWYGHVCAVDTAGNPGAVATGGPYLVDTTGPTGLTVISTSHTVSTWSNDATIDFTFSGASDPSGIAGYSIAFDTSATTEPDGTPDQAGTSFTGTASPDGANWYVHVRACDGAGACGATVHLGPFQIDTTAPGAPGAISSATHGVGVPSTAMDITVAWQGATDTHSGVVSYRYAFTASPVPPFCNNLSGMTTGLTATKVLADGDWYFHVCAIDLVGHEGAIATAGPYVFDAAQVAGRLYWTSFQGSALGTEAPAGTAKVLLAADGALGVALDVPGGHVYWASLWGSIHRSALDGTGDVVLMDGLAAPHGVALDTAAGKIYWMERGSLKLRRANLDGTGQEDLLTATGPYVSNLALDLVHGKVYWVETAMARIRRANLDGSSVEDVLTGIPEVVGLELDVPRGRIFWAEYRSAAANGLVGRANLDGTGKVTLAGGREAPNAMAFDAATGWLYFAEHSGNRIGRVKADGTGAGVALSLPSGPEGMTLFRLDSTAPTDPPSVASTSHSAGSPSNDPTIDVAWSGASDAGSGLAGYRTLFDQSAGTVPGDPVLDPSVVVVAHSADPHAVSSVALGDGSWTFHLSTCDVAGFCTSTRHAGPYVIDTTPPSAPGVVTSASHGDGLPKSDPTIDIAWAAATDNLSGIALYRIGFTSSSTQPSCLGLSQTTTDLTTVSTALADGTWYAHVCAVDAAGNPGAVATGGPYLVDTTGPTGLTVTSTSHTVSTWSNDATIDFGFSGAGDPSGVAGYAVAFDRIVGTEPACAETQVGTSFTGTASPDGDDWWIHVRARDGAGNCGVTFHLGPFRIDATAPSAPSPMTSASHGDGLPKSDPTIDIAWGAATDNLSGVALYRYGFTTSSTQPSCPDLSSTTTTLTGVSGALADGTWYAHVCAVDTAGNPGAVTTGGAYRIDTAGPTGLTVTSASHTISAWSNDATIDFTFSGAFDPSGVEGYSIVFDQLAGTEPPCAVTQVETSFTGTATPSGDTWWIHVRARDAAGNCGATLDLGPFWIDTTAPSAPGAVTSASHGDGLPKSDPTIDIAWGAATDGLSGVARYRYAFTPSSTEPSCVDLPQTTTGTSATSNPLAGGTWYAHVCAVDAAGNPGGVTSGGPYVIDATPPRVASVSTVRDTGDGVLSQGEVTGASITQVYLFFDEPMAAGVELPTSYRLTGAGPDLTLQTSGCGALSGDDVAVGIAAVDWSAPSLRAALRLAGTTALPIGLYGAAACATLTDTGGNSLDGDGNGTGGDDFVRLFGVETANLLVNPNIDADLAGWTLAPAGALDLSWSSADADGKPTSGSARMATAASHPGTWSFSQCLPVTAATAYRAALSAQVTGGGTGTEPEVRLGVEGFTDAACDGSSTSTRATTLAFGPTLDWVTAELRGFRPSSALVAHSVRMRAEVLGFGIIPAYTVEIDQPLFALDVDMLMDGFESGDFAGWSATRGGGSE